MKLGKAQDFIKSGLNASAPRCGWHHQIEVSYKKQDAHELEQISSPYPARNQLLGTELSIHLEGSRRLSVMGGIAGISEIQ